MSQILLPVLRELSMARTLGQFAASLESLACEHTGARRALYYRYERGEELLRSSSGEVLAVSEETLPGWSATFRESLAIQDGHSDSRFIPGEPGFANAGVAPIRSHGALLGILALIDRATGFDEDTMRIVDEVCQIAAIAHELVEQREDCAGLMSRTQDLLVRAMNAVDPSSEEHLPRVARLASELAGLMDLSSQSQHLLWEAAHYHDVGKLLLAGRTDVEIQQGHPIAGGNYLSSIRALQELAPIVEAHHERYDGSGFPRALAGDEIPLEACVLALAEDIAELWNESGTAGFDDKLAIFFQERASAHHPAPIDALAGLVDCGRLRKLLD